MTESAVLTQGLSVLELDGMLRSAGVADRHLASRFEDFEPRTGTRRALDTARRLAAEAPGPGFIQIGPPGSGKTTLVVAMIAERFRHHLAQYPSATWELEGQAGVTVVRRPRLVQRLVVVPQLLDDLRAAGRRSGGPDPLDDLADADVLVLDDLGRERTTDWATERLFVVVDRRYGSRRPTYVTTNLELGQLADRGYDAMVSRLVEDADVVRLTATDYRARAAG